MTKYWQDFATRFFKKDIELLPDDEKEIVKRFFNREPISRDTNEEFDTTQTFGEKIADRVASFGGSWTFIISFGVVLAGWVVLNSFVLARSGNTFDPYPYILLNLFLSMLASIQAPVILMSQNRQAAKDRLDATHDYEVNLKAELEILGLHAKIDELKENKWAELVQMQQEQISLLTQLLEKQSGK